jgi:hypothetical protein
LTKTSECLMVNLSGELIPDHEMGMKLAMMRQ